jgi:hypothetical protein
MIINGRNGRTLMDAVVPCLKVLVWLFLCDSEEDCGILQPVCVLMWPRFREQMSATVAPSVFEFQSTDFSHCSC